MKYLSKFTVIGLLVLLVSCGSTQQVVIKSMEPAKVDLSDKVVRIGILNSGVNTKEANKSQGIERLVAIEDQWLSKKGQDEALKTLVLELQKDNRFEVEVLDSSANYITGLSENLGVVSWNKVKSICEENRIDALFHLTHFDAETAVSLKKTKMEQLDMMREKTRISAQEITLETLIQNGWRIYDPYLEEVVDEFTYSQQLISKAKGINPVAALRAIGSRRDSMLSKGRQTGNLFGERFKPYEREIPREYYVKGTDKLVQAGKIMDTGDLSMAIKLWEEEVDNPKEKIKGRACHNLAVGMELNGDLVQAIEWAIKANQNFNDKSSLGYLKDLEKRRSQETIVKEQLAHLSFED